VVLEMPEACKVPTSGTVDYQYVILPTKCTENRWVSMSEVRPGNRALVHHVIAFIREPNSKWYRDKRPGEVFVPDLNEKGERRGISGGMLSGYAPGMPPEQMEPGQARLVKAGSDVVLQLHYTANGKAGEDQTRVGVVFAKEPPKERVMTLGASTRDFTIPPGDPNYRVDAEFEMGHEAKLVALLPHMHFRGKDFEYRLVLPNGETQTLLRVPNYDFNWQLAYKPAEDIVVPAGSRFECTAHFDNSPNNPNNPDPKASVRFGEQSWEEMAIGFMDLAVDAKMDLRSLFTPQQPVSR